MDINTSSSEFQIESSKSWRRKEELVLWLVQQERLSRLVVKEVVLVIRERLVHMQQVLEAKALMSAKMVKSWWISEMSSLPIKDWVQRYLTLECKEVVAPWKNSQIKRLSTLVKLMRWKMMVWIAFMTPRVPNNSCNNLKSTMKTSTCKSGKISFVTLVKDWFRPSTTIRQIMWLVRQMSKTCRTISNLITLKPWKMRRKTRVMLSISCRSKNMERQMKVSGMIGTMKCMSTLTMTCFTIFMRTISSLSIWISSIIKIVRRIKRVRIRSFSWT